MYPAETSLYHAVLAGALVLFFMVIGFLITILVYQKRKFALHKTMVRSEINALEKERARIAGDLHDDLGASLSAIKLKLQCLVLANEKEKQIVHTSENYIDEAMLKLKRISFNLMPRVLERKGLEQALHELVDVTEQTIAITINFRYACPPVSAEKTVHIYRIIQEALNNMVKHSGATVATVELQQVKTKISLRITDNGKGFDKNTINKATAGQGLQNMLARAGLLNAKMFVTAAPGHGVEYLIQIPPDI